MRQGLIEIFLTNYTYEIVTLQVFINNKRIEDKYYVTKVIHIIISNVIILLQKIDFLNKFLHLIEYKHVIRCTNFTNKLAIREVQLTKTVVTIAFTSPLYAIANSANLFAMSSTCLSLPFTARRALKQTN